MASRWYWALREASVSGELVGRAAAALLLPNAAKRLEGFWPGVVGAGHDAVGGIGNEGFNAHCISYDGISNDGINARCIGNDGISNDGTNAHCSAADDTSVDERAFPPESLCFSLECARRP
jgi:hypothetical protein